MTDSDSDTDSDNCEKIKYFNSLLKGAETTGIHFKIKNSFQALFSMTVDTDSDTQ